MTTKDYIKDVDNTELPKGKIKKYKTQCNTCGFIGYRLVCPECGGSMYKYKDRIGIKF